MADDKKKILVCEDEIGVRESLKLILADKYELVFTLDGEACLKALAQQEKDFSLVLMDIKLPKRNGIEITKEITRLYPRQKVVMVTGYGSVEIAQQSMEAGAVDYIVKPFDSEDVKRKTAKHIL